MAPRKVPVLGIIYNVVTLGGVITLAVAAFTQSQTFLIVGVLMLVPTIILPGSREYIKYWEKFDDDER